MVVLILVDTFWQLEKKGYIVVKRIPQNHVFLLWSWCGIQANQISAVCGPTLYNLSSLYDTKETSPKLHQYFLQNPVERLTPVPDFEGADEILSLMLS